MYTDLVLRYFLYNAFFTPVEVLSAGVIHGLEYNFCSLLESCLVGMCLCTITFDKVFGK